MSRHTPLAAPHLAAAVMLGLVSMGGSSLTRALAEDAQRMPRRDREHREHFEAPAKLTKRKRRRMRGKAKRP